MQLLEPGQIFAERYRVESFLASGGMGAVFVAMHLLTEMKVALKVLRPELLSDEAARERFELEAKVAARVKSEHIVKVIDAGTDEQTGLSFLVMELLVGKSLEQLVEEFGPLPPGYVVGVLLQVAEGLELAHRHTDSSGVRKPIVHRDLKPENLFIVRCETPTPLVKILDFGIAKVLSETGKVSQELKGTPLYMAYEQATGQAVSPATDVWALGLIAFYALVGRPYWKSLTLPEGSVASLFSEILSLPLSPASARSRELGAQRELPAGFDAWFARCIERRPERRFESASSAIFALQAVFGVLPFDETLKAQVSTARNFRPPSLPIPAQYDATVSANALHQGGSTTGTLAVDSTPGPAKTSRAAVVAVSSAVLLLGAGAVILTQLGAEPARPVPSTHGSVADGTQTGEPHATPPPAAESASADTISEPVATPTSSASGTPSSESAQALPSAAPTVRSVDDREVEHAPAPKRGARKNDGLKADPERDPYDER